MISVIIPSKTASNLDACALAIVRHEFGKCRVVCVDDGVEFTEDRSVLDFAVDDWLPGDKPFVFARNINRGILFAISDSDCEGVVLLNDDAILQTPDGFSIMAQACKEHPEYGLISATTNLAGNPQQKPHGVGLRQADRTVAFVCVYIPRTTIERIGLLDERFTAYGWEDNDYCRRVLQAGLNLGVHDGCYVDHGSLKSTFRGDPKAAGDIRGGAEIYRAKWGDLA